MCAQIVLRIVTEENSPTIRSWAVHQHHKLGVDLSFYLIKCTSACQRVVTCDVIL